MESEEGGHENLWSIASQSKAHVTVWSWDGYPETEGWCGTELLTCGLSCHLQIDSVRTEWNCRFSSAGYCQYGGPPPRPTPTNTHIVIHRRKCSILRWKREHTQRFSNIKAQDRLGRRKNLGGVWGEKVLEGCYSGHCGGLLHIHILLVTTPFSLGGHPLYTSHVLGRKLTPPYP